MAALMFLGAAIEPRSFNAMVSVQSPVALGWPVVGRNGEEPGKGDHIEQKFQPRRHGHPRSHLRQLTGRQ